MSLSHINTLERKALIARHAYRRELMRKGNTRYRMQAVTEDNPVSCKVNMSYTSIGIDLVWFTRQLQDVTVSFPQNCEYTARICTTDSSDRHRHIPLACIIEVLEAILADPTFFETRSWGLPMSELQVLLDSLRKQLHALRDRAVANETLLYRHQMKKLKLKDHLCKDVAGIVEGYLAKPLSDGLVPKPVYGTYKKKRKRKRQEEEKAS